MPVGGKLDRQVNHIIDSCMERGKKKKECERMAWATVNSQKKSNEQTERPSSNPPSNGKND
jgi:hypothetical protein